MTATARITQRHDPLRVVVVGGGIAGLEAILTLRELAPDRARITLLEPAPSFSYRALSVEGAFAERPPTTYPLDRIAADLDVELIADGFRWLAPAAHTVHTTAGAELEYDTVLLALGARRAPAFGYATTIDDRELHAQFEPLRSAIAERSQGSVAILVPSLPNWPVAVYELALMAAAASRRHRHAWSVHLVTPETAPLVIFGAEASAAVADTLADGGVTLHVGATPQMHTPGVVSLYPGDATIEVDQAYALPELFGPAVPGVPTSAERGFITVDRHGAVVGLDGVYAAGDAVDSPLKVGGIAAQQAELAATAIARQAGVDVRAPLAQQRLRVVLLGGPSPLHLEAQASYLHGITEQVSTARSWRMSDKVDATRLDAYLERLSK